MSAIVTTPLKYLVTDRITNGVGLPAEHDNPGWPRYIRTTDIAGPRSLRDDVWYSQPPELLQKASVQRNDLLLTNAGMTVGKSYLHVSDTPGVYAGYLTRVRPDTRRVDPRYLSYFTEAQPYWDQINVGATRSTIDNFSSGKYQDLEVPLPTLETQRRVADMLDEETARIDTLIGKNETAWYLAERKLREEIASAVTLGLEPNGRRPTGTAWAPEIGSSWDWAPYQYLAEIGTGHTPSRSSEELWVDCTIPWVTTADVKHLRDHRREYLEDTEHHLSELGMAHSAARLLPAHTVALSRTASVGFSAIMAEPMATSQDFFAWTCDERRLLPEYLLYVLRAMKFRGHFERLMRGSTHQTIYFPDLVQLRGPVPPVAEQRAIVDHIRQRAAEVHRLTARMQRMNDLLRQRREALITAAVTGEIDV